MIYNIKIFIIVLLISLVSGCSTSNTKDVNTILVWHWMSDREDTFQELAKRYESEAKVKIKFELYAPSEAYTQKVKASAQTDTLPDIFGVLGEKRDFASFIHAGHILDLSGELNSQADNSTTSWKDTFYETGLSINEFLPNNEFHVPAGTYGIPLDMMTIKMIYNKKLFKEAGLDPEKPPVTWDEFLSICRLLKEKGIPRFVSGFGEIWMIDALASNFAMNIMGEDKVFDTYRGKVSYTDPDWIKVLSLFQKMGDEGILVEGAVTMANKSAEQVFANERAAFTFNGSWSLNVYMSMNPNLDLAPMLPPKISNAHPVRIWGRAGSSFVVNAKSPRRAEAVKFLKWLTAAEQQAAFASRTQNLPANKNSLKKIPPVLKQFTDSMDLATHPYLYPAHQASSVTEAFDKGIQLILIGEKTAQEVARDVQKSQEKAIGKANVKKGLR